MRKALIAAVSAMMFSAAGISISGFASAATAAHDRTSIRPASAGLLNGSDGPFELCLSYNSSYCAVAHGAGNTMTIQKSGWAQVTVTAVSGLPQGYDFLSDSAGNCIGESTSGRVIIDNGRCAKDNDTEIWAIGGGTGSGVTIINYGYTDFMRVNGLVSGYNIYAGNENGFYHWVFCNSAACVG